MAGTDAQRPTRPAAFAGSWYPREEGALRSLVDGYLTPGDVPLEDVRALVAPHAGLMYSGRIAGRAYAAIGAREAEVRRDPPGRPDLVVLVGPSHSSGFEGVAVYPRGTFETPLGSLPIDAGAADALVRADPVVHANPSVHAREHSLELQLPFLARVLPGIPIVPLLMGRQTRSTVEALSRALAASLEGRRALLVASSDLSHFHDRRTAAALDAVVVTCIDRNDPDGLQAALERFPGHACGGGPVTAVMRAARTLGSNGAHVLQYGDSGDVSGDVARVVGYVSAVFGRTRAS